MTTDITVHGRLRPISDDTVRHAVSHVLAGEGREATVSVTFLGRDRMRQLNAQYKGRPHPTDVLAFALADPGGAIVGDIYICPWVAQREAASRDLSLHQELLRLVVHGTLHVLGYDHPEADRTASDMWRRQEGYVRALI